MTSRIQKWYEETLKSVKCLTSRQKAEVQSQLNRETTKVTNISLKVKSGEEKINTFEAQQKSNTDAIYNKIMNFGQANLEKHTTDDNLSPQEQEGIMQKV